MSTKNSEGDGSKAAAAVGLPKDFEIQSRKRFEQMEDKHGTFEDFLAADKREFMRMANLQANPTSVYVPTLGTQTPCGNGDFENGLDPAEWQGAYGNTIGNALDADGNLIGSWTAGIGPNVASNTTDFDVNDFNAHQTWVSTSMDMNAPISTTAPGSSGAVRIGNAVNGCGTELLSKTFVVNQPYVTFWYAVVMDNGTYHHKPAAPSFSVHVKDASQVIIPNAFNFGGGTNALFADFTNPIFETIQNPKSPNSPNEYIVWKNWSCAQIDLSSQKIGSVVTIEFITKDCLAGAHWCYAYIDNFCGSCAGSPSGTLSYDCAGSSHCGQGKICFDYTLPTAKDPKTGNPITGEVEIKLNIYQNGSTTPLQTISSGVLNSGSSFCFNIDPATVPGIDMSLGGLDFSAVGDFTISGFQLGNTNVGVKGEGVMAGVNNDYKLVCKTCDQIKDEQNAYLAAENAGKVNQLQAYDCDCPDDGSAHTGCSCTQPPKPNERRIPCAAIEWPSVKPCIAVKWGDSACDCIETDDVETLCITVCNCYTNVTFECLSIGRIIVTNSDGTPVATLPDGTPSVEITPSGPICFGTIAPCKDNHPTCVSREIVLQTRGARSGNYHVEFEGVCYDISHHQDTSACFVLPLCADRKK